MLRDHLPIKGEHVILVRLSPIQRALYTEFMKRFREAGNSGWLGLNPLKAFCVCCKVRLFSLRPFLGHAKLLIEYLVLGPHIHTTETQIWIQAKELIWGG